MGEAFLYVPWTIWEKRKVTWPIALVAFVSGQTAGLYIVRLIIKMEDIYDRNLRHFKHRTALF